MPDKFRVGIHDTSSEFRLKLEGRFGAADSREVESCWRTAASTINGRRFTVDVSRVKSLDSTATELLSQMRNSGAELVCESSGHPLVPGGLEKLPVGGSAHMDNSFRPSLLPMLIGCLLSRLKAWAGWSPRSLIDRCSQCSIHLSPWPGFLYLQ